MTNERFAQVSSKQDVIAAHWVEHKSIQIKSIYVTILMNSFIDSQYLYCTTLRVLRLLRANKVNKIESF